MGRFFSIIIVSFFLFGCAPDVDQVVKDWEEKGWSKVRKHGLQKDYKRHSILMSERAKAVEVSWVQNGERKTKLYRQDSHYYMALRFFCNDDDEFAIVMRKRK